MISQTKKDDDENKIKDEGVINKDNKDSLSYLSNNHEVKLK